MRIDSGLQGHYYQNRYQYDRAETEEASNETAANPRRASNPAFSSTLLSSNLASALWVIEGGKTDETAAKATATSAEDPLFTATPEQIEARYLEFVGDE